MIPRRAHPARAFLLPALSALFLFAILLAGTTLSAQQPDPPPATPTQAEPQAAAPAPAAPAAAAPAEAERPAHELIGNVDEPADGKWLTDPEGMQYFIKPIKKELIVYKHVDESTIRLRGGPWYKLADEDDDTVYLKVFRAGQRGTRTTGRPQPSDEELAAAAATFQVEVGEADVLRFEPFDQGLPRVGMWRNGFAVADMNGDGHLDVIHGKPRRSPGGPRIFLGDGAGNWQLWQEVTFPQAPYDYGDAAAADFNGDGHMDVALAMHMRGVLVLVGDGKGKFELWTEGVEMEWPGHKGEPAFTSRTLEVVDWDGDGDTDILVLAEGPRGFEHVSLRGGYGRMLYLNQGDGTWDHHFDSSRIYGNDIVLGDFNGDGRIDFANSTHVGGFRELINLGQDDGKWTSVEAPEMRRGVIWSMATADFDGNGRSDLVTSYYGNTLGVRRAGLDVLLAQEDGSWTRRPLAVSERKPGQALTHYTATGTGDIDGDGAFDLVASARDGQMAIFRGDGKGGFTREVEAELEQPQPGCDGYHFELVDLDGDGRDEVLASFAGEECPTGGSIRAWRVVPASDPGNGGRAVTNE